MEQIETDVLSRNPRKSKTTQRGETQIQLHSTTLTKNANSRVCSLGLNETSAVRMSSTHQHASGQTQVHLSTTTRQKPKARTTASRAAPSALPFGPPHPLTQAPLLSTSTPKTPDHLLQNFPFLPPSFHLLGLSFTTALAISRRRRPPQRYQFPWIWPSIRPMNAPCNKPPVGKKQATGVLHVPYGWGGQGQRAEPYIHLFFFDDPLLEPFPAREGEVLPLAPPFLPPPPNTRRKHLVNVHSSNRTGRKRMRNGSLTSHRARRSAVRTCVVFFVFFRLPIKEGAQNKSVRCVQGLIRTYTQTCIEL